MDKFKEVYNGMLTEGVKDPNNSLKKAANAASKNIDRMLKILKKNESAWDSSTFEEVYYDMMEISSKIDDIAMYGI